MATEETKPVERPTINDAARVIRKIEACEGTAAKLIILRNFAGLAADAALERAAALMRTKAEDLGKQGYDEFHKAADAIEALKGSH